MPLRRTKTVKFTELSPAEQEERVQTAELLMRKGVSKQEALRRQGVPPDWYKRFKDGGSNRSMYDVAPTAPRRTTYEMQHPNEAAAMGALRIENPQLSFREIAKRVTGDSRNDKTVKAVLGRAELVKVAGVWKAIREIDFRERNDQQWAFLEEVNPAIKDRRIVAKKPGDAIMITCFRASISAAST